MRLQMRLKMIINVEYVRIWNERAASHLKLLSQSLPEEIHGREKWRTFMWDIPLWWWYIQVDKNYQSQLFLYIGWLNATCFGLTRSHCQANMTQRKLLCNLHNHFFSVLFACWWLPVKPKHVALNHQIYKKSLVLTDSYYAHEKRRRRKLHPGHSVWEIIIHSVTIVERQPASNLVHFK